MAVVVASSVRLQPCVRSQPCVHKAAWPPSQLYWRHFVYVIIEYIQTLNIDNIDNINITQKGDILYIQCREIENVHNWRYCVSIMSLIKNCTERRHFVYVIIEYIQTLNIDNIDNPEK